MNKYLEETENVEALSMNVEALPLLGKLMTVNTILKYPSNKPYQYYTILGLEQITL